MLIRFRASNFRSLRDEQELSMVAAFPEARKNLIHLQELELELVRVAGIYGANAAGKSNILEALLFMKTAVRDSHREWPPEGPIPREPFVFDIETLTAASIFEVDFAIDGILYQYGFSLDSERILEEWLHAYPQKHKQTWFKRHHNSFTFSRHLRGNNKTIEQLTRKNSLFLSAAAQNNHQGLAPIHLWLTGKLEFYRNNDLFARSQYRSNKLLADERFRSKLLNYLRLADLGIEGIGIHQEALSDEARGLTTDLLKIVRPESNIQELLPEDFRILQPELQHRTTTGSAPLNFNRESSGTQAWFSLLFPILNALDKGSVLFIDELDTSLHPKLAKEAIRFFQNPETNPNNAQLIFNTHDTTLLGNLLGDPSLQRDQVWLTEKDEKGATHIYPLTDFKPRKLENVERGYLQGRYGAVPFIGQLMVGEDD
ncbi:MAG TPA: AAA family ATPase [Thermoanaerobaculia bacterium]